MDARLFVRSTPHEKTPDFNQRLLRACQESPITSFDAVVVDGQPAIMLHSELDEADEEDVKAAKEDGETIAVGDLIPVDEPICVQVSGLGAVGDNAAKSEVVLDRLNKRGDGAITETRFIEGEITEWIPDRNACDSEGKPLDPNKPKQIPSRVKVVYAVVAFIMAQYKEDGDKDDKGKGKK